MKVCGEVFGPYSVAAARFIGAGVLLLFVLRFTRGSKEPLSVGALKTSIVGVLLAFCVAEVVRAETTVGSGTAAICLGAIPLVTVGIGRCFGQKVGRMQVAAILLGLIAVAVLGMQPGISGSNKGFLSLCIAVGSWSLGSALSKKWAIGGTLKTAGFQMVAGGTTMLFFAIARGESFGLPAPKHLWALSYLVVCGSAAAHMAYLFLLARSSSAIATSYAFVNPVLALLWGALLFGERIGWTEISAAILVLVSLILLFRANAAKQ